MRKTIIYMMAFLAVISFSTSCKKDKNEPEPLKVLIMGAEEDASWIADVRNKVESTDLFEQVDTFNLVNKIPTSELLNEYDAVFVFTDDGAYDPVATGDTLAAYIEAGGGVVNAVFTGNVAITGDFTTYALITETDQESDEVRTLGSVTNSQHFIMKNIVDFNGGTSSFYNNGGTIDAGATILAKYDNDAAFIIIKENVGPKKAKRVFLNFFPPSKDVRDDFWDPSTDGALIMGYSLVWVAN